MTNKSALPIAQKLQKIIVFEIIFLKHFRLDFNNAMPKKHLRSFTFFILFIFIIIVLFYKFALPELANNFIEKSLRQAGWPEVKFKLDKITWHNLNILNLFFDRERSLHSNKLVFTLVNTNKLIIKKSVWGWGQGQLNTNSLTFDLSAHEIPLELTIKSIDLGQFIALIPGNHIAGTSTLRRLDNFFNFEDTRQEQEKTNPEKVGERNARRNFNRAAKEIYLKGVDGKWHQQKIEGMIIYQHYDPSNYIIIDGNNLRVYTVRSGD